MKKQFLSTSLALLLCLSCAAQKNTAEKFSVSINKENAYKHLSVLASDEYEGRETGKKGAWMAADYIKNYFKSQGLKGPVNGGYFQPIDMVTYNLSGMKFSINGQPKQYGKDFVISSSTVTLDGFNFNTSDIVFAGYGLDQQGYNDFEGIDVAGKVVLLFANGDPTIKGGSPAPADRASRRKMMAAQQAKIQYLAAHKALAVIQIDPSLDQITEEMKANYSGAGQPMLKNAENTAKMQGTKTLASIRVTTATANELLKAAGTTVAALQEKIVSAVKPASQLIKVAVSGSASKAEVKVRAENVLGFLEGSDPVLKDEILVVTGHYDHIGLTTSGTDKVNNGADDDGSGTTGVLLIADAFVKAKKAGKGPKRSILFMTVVGEEKGLLGSEWYSEHPVFPLAKTITDLNIDMIGRVDEAHKDNPEYIYIIGSDMLSSDLNATGIKANEDNIKMNLDMKYNNRTDPNQFYYRSDHYNFAKHGIPVIFYFSGVHEDYHQPGDEVSKINFDLLSKRAQLVYYTAWELANGAKRPVVDKNDDGTAKK
ncbi:Zn-dependent amino-or carboxypeptidase, M28 family [Pedobacter westerhofensis]|uniref:Zn-dependent amino-or carboxypeptidase, M28 family n=1 Tax=Pedobacter westerhofensis TaxID=425512 RepID=A0A521C339_9SPHI|nr:M28 family peptidase [Pedobacter westerhofensis]SMO53818.1 Zn-dependent amino-or carboxypeptidase, M28 family [Pedobacter westerhofensis]